MVSMTYNPNRARTSEAYLIEYIEIGFFGPQWTVLERKEGYNYTQRCSVVLPVSLKEVKRELQVAVKYKSCSTVIYSDSKTVEQPAVCEFMSLQFHAQQTLTDLNSFRLVRACCYNVGCCSYSDCSNKSSLCSLQPWEH